MAKIREAGEVLEEMIGSDESLRRMIEDQRVNLRIAQLVYDARTSAGLTQAALAKRIKMKRKVVADLEDADYEGNPLPVLRRIAEALGREIKLAWAPVARNRKKVS